MILKLSHFTVIGLTIRTLYVAFYERVHDAISLNHTVAISQQQRKVVNSGGLISQKEKFCYGKKINPIKDSLNEGEL